MDFTRKMLGLRNEKSLSSLGNGHQTVLSEVKNTGKEIEQNSIKLQQVDHWEKDQPLYRQEENFKFKTWEVDPNSNEKQKTMIQRDDRVQIVPVQEIKLGDVFLIPYTDDLHFSKESIIDQFDLKVNYQGGIYIKAGEVVHLQELELAGNKQGHINDYKDLLAPYKIDKQLVPLEKELYSQKDVYLSAANLNRGNNEIINTALQKNGELDKVVDRTLSLNQMSSGESYKVIDFITADGKGLNNKILYLEDEKGNVKSYGIGKEIEPIKYKEGQTVKLENVLRNSLPLLANACQNIENRREVEISKEVAMER